MAWGRIGLVGLSMVALSGCGGDAGDNQSAEALDNALVGEANDADPALTSALADQIMVDPTLTQQANGTSAKPTETPIQAPIPPDLGTAKPAAAEKDLLRTPAPTPTTTTANPTLGEVAKLQASAQQGRANQTCLKGLKYSLGWAQRLPAAIPLYPQAQVSEAAGNDDNGCRVRVVSFVSGTALQPVLDWYYTKAIRGGYSAEHQLSGGEHILAGTKGNNAFYLLARDKNGKTEVDLVASTPG